MNWDKLAEALYWRMRLRPIPKRFLGNEHLEPEDDVWIVQGVEKGKAVELSNSRTGHVAHIGNDHIHHYVSDPASETDGLKHGFLELTVQITLRGSSLEIEPLSRRTA